LNFSKYNHHRWEVRKDSSNCGYILLFAHDGATYVWYTSIACSQRQMEQCIESRFFLNYVHEQVYWWAFKSQFTVLLGSLQKRCSSKKKCKYHMLHFSFFVET
jgi:hypothetical protein